MSQPTNTAYINHAYNLRSDSGAADCGISGEALMAEAHTRARGGWRVGRRQGKLQLKQGGGG